jgi:quinoprotein glucose dehydrogenase
MSRAGSPIIKPPWQTITAYDLEKGTILWKVPVGGMGDRKNTGGTLSNAGLAVTAGKLVLSANESDRNLYAWDSETGKLLWQAKLPSTPGGEPAIYESGGREFIVWPASNTSSVTELAAGELGAPRNTKPGVNSYVAFALPATP